MDEIFPDLREMFDDDELPNFPNFCIDPDKDCSMPSERKLQQELKDESNNKARFGDLSEKDLNSLIENRLSAKTKKATNWTISTIKSK